MSEESKQPAEPKRNLLEVALRATAKYVKSMKGLVVIVASLAAAVTILLEKSGSGWKAAIAFGSIALGSALVFDVFPAWRARRRSQRLTDWAIEGRTKRSEYFRIGPFESTDEDVRDFSRADGAHEQVLRWLRTPPEPILFLTGRSGTGKSSLLNAHVIPSLTTETPETRVLAVRAYDDPLIALKNALLTPDVVFQRPPSEDETHDARKLLERAAEYLRTKKQRLLVVLDQFEEFVIVRDRESQQIEAFQSLLRSLSESAVDGLTVLISIRSDYNGFLQDLDLPPLNLASNWVEVRPFTVTAARDFLEGSGLSLGPKVLDGLMAEMVCIEETKGLVRPIVVNLVGMIAANRAAEISRSGDTEKLILDYVRECIQTGDAQDSASAILRSMVTEAGTKRPRSVAEVAEVTHVTAPIVEGTLLELNARGLVRPIDNPKDIRSRVWEISHDFVARIIQSILNRQRPSFWRLMVSWMTPISVLIGAVALAVIPTYLRYHSRRVLEELDVQLVHPYLILESGRSDIFPDVMFSAITRSEVVPRAARHLRRLNRDDIIYSPTDLRPLKELGEIEHLLISFWDSGEPVRDLQPVFRLRGLRALHVSGVNVSGLNNISSLSHLDTLELDYVNDVGEHERGGTVYESFGTTSGILHLRELRGLRNLVKLRISHTNVDGFESLGHLTNLQLLVIESNRSDNRKILLSDADFLSNLKNLRTLSLAGTDVADISVIGGLKELEYVNLEMTKVSRVDGLTNLKQLNELDLSRTKVTDITPLVKLVNLRLLDLTDCEIVDWTPLERITGLKSLTVRDGQIPESRLRSLRRALPGLRVELREIVAESMVLPSVVVPSEWESGVPFEKYREMREEPLERLHETHDKLQIERPSPRCRPESVDDGTFAGVSRMELRQLQ